VGIGYCALQNPLLRSGLRRLTGLKLAGIPNQEFLFWILAYDGFPMARPG